MSRRRPSIKTVLSLSLPKEGRLLLGVSGGVDSMVMLHGAVSVERLLGLRIEVIHVDHNLRPDSREDAQFVVDSCRDLGVVCHLKKLESRPPKTNLESWARERRYNVFSEILEERGLDLILTAHNANDVAETLLMRLCANKEPNSILGFDRSRRCLRPLLQVTRSEIESYSERYSIQYREDPSNNSDAFLRNRFRNRVLPTLENEVGKSVVHSLALRARSLASDEGLLDRLAEQSAEKLSRLKLWSKEWVSSLESEPEPIRWRVIERVLYPNLGFSLGYAKSSEVLELIRSKSGSMRLKGNTELRIGVRGIELVSCSKTS